MASNLLFDPRLLLRIAPLMSATASLWYDVDQYVFFNNFIVPPNREKGSAILPGYWKTFLGPGLVGIFGLHGISIIGGAVNSYLGHSQWYGIGAALSLTHFVFVPAVAPHIRALIDDESKGQSWKDMEKWLRVHTVRSVLVDTPAWFCYLMGVMAAVRTI